VKRNQRGYSLLELLVGSSIGVFVTLAGVAFTTNQTRMYGVTTETLELSQASRSGLARLVADLRLAGLGVGYGLDGNFAGIELGTFSRGTAQFGANNFLVGGNTQNGTSSNQITDDLGILFANGRYATVAAFNPAGSGQLCAGSGIAVNDIILLRSEDGLHGRTVRVTSKTAGACQVGQCAGGCEDFGWASDASFSTGAAALTASYAGGEAATGFQRVTWFVERSDPSRTGSRLRRVVGDCARRDHTCGEVVLDDVETLQFRVYQRARTGWTDRTGGGAVGGPERLRVDVELVLASAREVLDAPAPPAQSTLENQLCVPTCGTRDLRLRRVVKTSVEIKNSGRMSFERRAP